MDKESDNLSIKTKFGYGLGRVFNVMFIAMINTYMLKFYISVVQLNGTNAGLIMIVGKITGGLSTVVVGMLADREKDCWIYEKIGRRKVLL